MEFSIQDHWDKVFSTKKSDKVSWYQPYPTTSMYFVDALNLPRDANIIDIGGGDSQVVDALLDKGYYNVHVLDVSSVGLERAKDRLGERASKVHWIVSDVTAFKPEVQFDLWHDRAAFHFLTSESQVTEYVNIASAAIKTGAYLLIGTFSESGPGKCSGLDVKQYSETSLSDTFQSGFDKVKCMHEDHITPSGVTQNFLFCSFKRK